MIEINLLPGDGKKKRRANTTKGLKFEIRPADLFAGLLDKITDKYLLGAIGAGALSALTLLLLWIAVH